MHTCVCVCVCEGPIVFVCWHLLTRRIYFIWAFEFQRNLHKNLFHMRVHTCRNPSERTKSFFLSLEFFPISVRVYSMRHSSFCRCLASGTCSCAGLQRPVQLLPNGFVCSFGTFSSFCRCEEGPFCFLSFVYRNEIQHIHGEPYTIGRALACCLSALVLFKCGNVQ